MRGPNKQKASQKSKRNRSAPSSSGDSESVSDPSSLDNFSDRRFSVASNVTNASAVSYGSDDSFGDVPAAVVAAEHADSPPRTLSPSSHLDAHTNGGPDRTRRNRPPPLHFETIPGHSYSIALSSSHHASTPPAQWLSHTDPIELDTARRASLPAYLLQDYDRVSGERYLGQAHREAQKKVEADMSELVRSVAHVLTCVRFGC